MAPKTTSAPKPKSASSTKSKPKTKRAPSAFAKFVKEFRAKNPQIPHTEMMKAAAASPEWKKIQAELKAKRESK